jgi:hypothetical protein
VTGSASLCQFVVRSARPDALEGWYRDALGLGGADGHLVAGPVGVSVERDVGLARRAREPMRLMPNFVVDDAIVAERRLIGMGVTWIRELEATTWGRIATLLDPDGNYVQLFELPAREAQVTR